MRIAAILAAVIASISSVQAQEAVRIGLLLPLTGPFAPTGRQIEAGARLYLAQHGSTVAGKTIELIVRDDGNVADNTKRIAQELIVNDKIAILAGFGLTPLALATAPLATEAKIPQIVMGAATAIIPDRSPYIVRTSMVTSQITVGIADWAPKNGIKRLVTLVSDYAPGVDIEKAFSERFKASGGEVIEQVRVPLANPDFAPFLQRVSDLKPDALFVFVPAGVGANFMRQFVERGLDKSGIRLIGTGDMTDDDILNQIGDVAIGLTTSHHYSAAHPSALNKSFVEAFKKANNMRPNFMAVGGYDGMALIVKALEKTKGSTNGDELVGAMKGMAWESPRGPVSIDPATRDIVQNIYVRKVEKVGGELYNVEFATFEAVKKP
ncbi:MAG TPA: ABC transporter substrate-binding protein [Pseudorhodoplanes sp.]|jgi:branched-chain amino acid transport system substrate-binding protein|nr:ABC transporter substrate-binding protein [Pseudorhodoplanes sp.]